MINSVNFPNLNQTSVFDNKISAQNRQKNQAENIHFGDYYSGYYAPSHPLKDGLLSLTNGLIGLFGFNAVLWGIQDFVNGKILVGKINKHYTDKIHNELQLTQLASKMLEDNGLDKTVKREIGRNGEAYFTALGNKIVTGADKSSALFHEIGHSIIENNTTLLKGLQRFRGNYTILALGLYALMSQGQKKNQDVFGDEKQGFFTKAKNFLSRSTLLVPLLAFSPELITEAMASKLGIDFLSKQQKLGKISEEALKNIKKSYAACFGTYLFIPVSIIMMELLTSGIEKEINKHKSRDVYM